MKKSKRKLKKKFKLILLLLICVLILLILKNINKTSSIVPVPTKNKITTTTTKKIIIKDEVSLKVENYYQYPDYPTGCELSSLYMLLSFYKIDVTMAELNDNLIKGPSLYFENGKAYAANPSKEFVGDPKSEYSYGVFNEPIKDLANKYKKGAISLNNADINKIKEILSSGNPIVAWYSITPNTKIEFYQTWLDYETEEEITWPSGEHAVLITGYSKENITYNDPNIGKSRTIDIETFLINFNILGGMIVYYN